MTKNDILTRAVNIVCNVNRVDGMTLTADIADNRITITASHESDDLCRIKLLTVIEALTGETYGQSENAIHKVVAKTTPLDAFFASSTPTYQVEIAMEDCD